MTVRAKRALGALAVLTLLACAAVFGAGEYLSAPVQRDVGDPPSELFATTVRIPAAGGHVAGWVARGSGKGAVLLLHGVRADRRQMVSRALWLNGQGYTVLLIDLASHGESPGKRITFGAHEAAGVRASLDWLTHHLPGERIGVIGVSLGGAALLLSDSGKRIDALVLEAVYPTIDEAVENRLGMRLGAPGRWLAPLLLEQIPLRAGVQTSELRPIDSLARLACPVLIVGGEVDRHTSEAETRRMHGTAHEPKALWIIPGAAHVDFHDYARAMYEQRVGAFLAAYLAEPAL